MRPLNTGSIFYQPGNPPDKPEELRRFLQDEFIKIQVAIDALIAGHLDTTHVAPVKPRDGDIRLADGTNWNPGAGGQGVYCYYNSTWNKLG